MQDLAVHQRQKKRKVTILLTIAALHQLYLLIYNYIHNLLHCFSEYCDCSIRVSQITDTYEALPKGGFTELIEPPWIRPC